jgi:hypothetical protein
MRKRRDARHCSHLPMALKHGDFAAQLRAGEEEKSYFRKLGGRQRDSEPFCSCTNLVDVAFAAGVHCLAYGALVTQFLDIP